MPESAITIFPSHQKLVIFKVGRHKNSALEALPYLTDRT